MAADGQGPDDEEVVGRYEAMFRLFKTRVGVLIIAAGGFLPDLMSAKTLIAW
jgi:Ca2+/Na+ antiporter